MRCYILKMLASPTFPIAIIIWWKDTLDPPPKEMHGKDMILKMSYLMTYGTVQL